MSTESTDETDRSTTMRYEEQVDGRISDERDDDRLERSVRMELLEEENRRLRAEYARARQSGYRRTAIGLAVIGLCSVLGGLLFPDSREVFIAFGATGLFGAALTYYLTPEQFVAADVGERVYTASAANGTAIATELGLGDTRVYMPAGVDDGAQLYVPMHSDFDLPADANGPFVLEADGRGLLLEPTGAPLFREFRQTGRCHLAAAPEPLAAQLCEALSEQFELAGRTDPDVDAATGRITVAVTNSAFGDVDRFDHPIGSFLAVGLAAGLDQPVDVTVDRGDDRSDWLITCRFEMEANAETTGDEAVATDDFSDSIEQ